MLRFRIRSKVIRKTGLHL